MMILARPETASTISAAFATMPDAAAAVQEIFANGFLPSSLEIADSFTLEAARKDLGQALVGPAPVAVPGTLGDRLG